MGVNDAANLDRATVGDFGREWRRFDQDAVGDAELLQLFQEYFAVFPWDSLPEDATGFDAGCGSGRWAALVAPRVGHLDCVDASAEAWRSPEGNSPGQANVSLPRSLPRCHAARRRQHGFRLQPWRAASLADPLAGLPDCVRKLKPGAPMLIYIYYAFDNRPAWFRLLWLASDYLRRAVAKAPFQLKSMIAELFVATIYLQLARSEALRAISGLNVTNWPLSAYVWRTATVCAPTRAIGSAPGSSTA